MENGVLCLLLSIRCRRISRANALKRRCIVDKKLRFVNSGIFVKKKNVANASGTLLFALDGLFHVDLPEFIKNGPYFRDAHDIILSNVRRDILLMSWNGKIIIIIEVTSPNDESLEIWRKENMDKYSKLKRWMACIRTCRIWSLQVRSPAFDLANSFSGLCSFFGIERPKKESLCGTVSKTMWRWSKCVCINSFNKKKYKRPINPCDIDRHSLSSKVKNLKEWEKAVNLIL